MAVVKLFVDGASRGNPGEAGIGAVVYDEKEERIAQGCKYLGSPCSNNRAEYEALLFGLELVKGHSNEVDVFSDSQLLVRQLNGQYRVKSADLKVLYLKAVDLKKDFTKITFTHIPREKNQFADQLANKAIDEQVA
jgi:ribonuclease HI